MINVNQITAQMSRMSDQALQQYAQMHKDDPYTLSLALNESNRRKQMRAEAQSGPAGQQPTVADQDIAQIVEQPQQPQQQMQPPQGLPQGQMAQAAPMPEEVGIGALPAPNMQGMAEGGIVAFSDGGEVQRFQVGGTAIEDIQKRSVEALRPLQAQVDQAEKMYVAAARSGDQAAITQYGKVLSDLKAQLAEKISTQFGNAGAAVQEQLKPVAISSPAISAAYPDEARRGAMTGAPLGVPAVAPGGLGSTAPAAKVRASAAPVAPILAPAATLPPTVPTAPAAPLTIDQFMSKEPLTDPLAAQRSAVSARQAQLDQQAKQEFEADVASRGVAGEGREKRLGERQAKLAEQAEASKNMSIVEAGLAMMQSRGRGLAGLAEGAGVGLKSYKAGIEKLTAAQERIDDARDQLDEYRRNEANMTNKERRLLSREIGNNTVAAEKDALKGMELAYGVKREDAKTMFTTAAQAQLTGQQIASSENIARLSRETQKEIAELGRKTQKEIAGMPSPQIQMITALGGGDFRKGYEIFKQEGAMPKLYETYTKMASDPINADKFLAKYPTFEVFKDASGLLGGGQGGILTLSDNAAGNIRPR